MKIHKNYPLASLCTLKIGGPADFCIEVSTPKQMQLAITFSQEKNLPFTILGKGSNTLFDDKGYRGVVIINKIHFIEKVNETTFSVGSGTNFPLLGIKTAKQGLFGLEFAAGVPASIGGAIFMNAGAFGQETKDTLTSVTYLNESGAIITKEIDKELFSYRSSPFQKGKKVILSATFTLKKDPGARTRQLAWLEKRKSEQPLRLASAGCIFKNPVNNSAGALIEKVGLKNRQIGDIIVSDQHANYLINKGSGTSEDLKKLICEIQSEVVKKTGHSLEHELRINI